MSTINILLKDLRYKRHICSRNHFCHDLTKFLLDPYIAAPRTTLQDVSLKSSLDVSGVNATIMRLSTQGNHLVAAGEGLLASLKLELDSPLLVEKIFNHIYYNQWRIYIVKFWTRPPPRGPNSFNFMQFSGKIGKIVCWRLPRGVCAPSSGKSWIRH